MEFQTGKHGGCTEGEEGVRRPFFSIVMPCYGVEAYIARAIECVQAQTFPDWELIVVDDCTPDESAVIAMEYAARDGRIRVVSHEENRGLSAARNTGIAQARGRYLWIPDPDDTYAVDILQRVHGAVCGECGDARAESEAAGDCGTGSSECAARIGGAADGGGSVLAADGVSAASGRCLRTDSLLDVVAFGYMEEYYDENGAFLYEHALPMEQGRYAEAQDWHGLVVDFERGTHFGYAWNKVYRLERVRELGLEFEQVRLIEDVVFNAAFFQNAVGMAVLDGMPYRYAKRRGSSLTNSNAYSWAEYYALHRRRIGLLRDLLDGWGVLDGRARGILGALYGRYVLSTLERQCEPAGALACAERRAWCMEVFRDPLFGELVSVAHAESAVLRMCLLPLRVRSAGVCVALGSVMHFARGHVYALFTRARSGR